MHNAWPPDADAPRRERVNWMLRALLDETVTDWDALSEWEQRFVESVNERHQRGGELTDRQFEVLEELYERV